MLSRQEEERERRATLENDRKVLEERGTTFHQHAMSNADETSQGRFRAMHGGAPHVIGSAPTAASQYPAASAAHQTELPPEEPLGYRVDGMPALEPSAPIPVVEQLGGADGAPSSLSPDVVEHAAPPSSSEGDPDNA